MSTPDTPWWQLAACLGMAPLFDAEGEERKTGRYDGPRHKAIADRYQAAANVCATCPVTRQCEADGRIGRDEGIRNGKVLPPLFAVSKKASRGAA
jgi:hypothetical protein